MLALPAGASTALPENPQGSAGSEPAATWRRGFDGQRIADLGNGRFLNPMIAGGQPDPANRRDGADYYKTV
jgi:xylan 1,4-beta-xylosidase